MKKFKILAIIPARGGSKGIKRKNIKPLAGRPLIAYTIEAAKKSRLINRIILSSDDKQIISYSKRQKIEAPFRRPKILAKDNTPMIKVVCHALDFLFKKEKYSPDFIVLLQPTSPLRKAKHIDEAVKLLIKSAADSAVSVIEAPHNFNPFSMMRLKNGFLKPFLKFDERNNLREKKPRFFARNGPAVLAFRKESLLNKKSLYGDKIIPYFMKENASIDIDNISDFKIAEQIIKSSKRP